MTNHLHLLILSGTKGLAPLMQPLLTGYVGAFNRRHRRVGHLVQNRFKAILCEAETYFQELVRYIHLNPVRAGLVGTFDQLALYPWTGHPALLGRIGLAWQAVDATLEHFGTTVSTAQQSYKGFLADGWTQGFREDLEKGTRCLRSTRQRITDPNQASAYDPRILGSSDFVAKILAQSEAHERQQREMSRAFGLTDLGILVCRATGLRPEALQWKERTRAITDARALFAYAATEHLKRPGTEVCKVLGMSSGGISIARRRGRRLAESIGFTMRPENLLDG